MTPSEIHNHHHAVARDLRGSDGHKLERAGVPRLAMIEGDLIRWAFVYAGADGAFEFAGDDSDGARSMFVMPCRNEDGEICDLIAFGGATTLPWRWLKRGVLLGAEQLPEYRPHRLSVHPSPFSWLKAGRQGVVVLDPVRAANLLDGIGLRVQDGRHRADLTRALTRRPDVAIEVPA